MFYVFLSIVFCVVVHRFLSVTVGLKKDGRVLVVFNIFKANTFNIASSCVFLISEDMFS